MNTERKEWGWVLAAGIALGGVGLISLSWPFTSTLSLIYALGLIFIVSSFILGFYSLQLRNEKGNGWRVLQSIVAFVAGFLMLKFPTAGLSGVAVAMVFYFFISAAAKVTLAFTLRPVQGWVWVLMSGIASFLLGGYMIATFPISALWLPGFILAIDFIFHGASLIGVSIDLKRTHKKIEDLTGQHREQYGH